MLNVSIFHIFFAKTTLLQKQWKSLRPTKFREKQSNGFLVFRMAGPNRAEWGSVSHTTSSSE